MFQHLNHLCGPSLDSLQYVYISLVLGSPELATGLQLWPHQRWVQRKDHLPWPAGNTLSNAAPDTIDHLCHKLVHVILGVHQDPQVLFCQVAFQLGGPQHILVHWVVLPHVEDFVLALVELQEVPVSPFPQPAEVPLSGSMTLWHLSCCSWWGVISKCAKGTICPVIQVINEDIPQDRTQKWPLGHSTRYWPPIRLCAIDHHSLGPAIQGVFNLILLMQRCNLHRVLKGNQQLKPDALQNKIFCLY